MDRESTLNEAAASRRNLQAGAWLGAASELEGRAYLQERLELISKLMFWSFATLIGFLVLMYQVYEDLSPEHNTWILAMAVGGLVVLAVIWRFGLLRQELPAERLILIDRFYAIGTGMTFGAAAFLSRDLAIAPFSCLLYASFMVLLRAIVVPSSGKRTAILGSLAFAPIVFASLGIAVADPLLKQPPIPLPGPAYVGGTILVGTVAVMLATVGSRIIYGLRRQVSAAMQLGQYTLVHKIGEGGMGTVYRARHAMLRRPTAVKLMQPNKVDAQTLDRFEKEVQHMSLLTHPNTVAVYDYGRSPDGVFYYAMEFLDGINLESLVVRDGAQPFDRVVAILTQVAGALAEAHRSDLIHRDIKPANIILCERGGVADVVKVVDFGLVKQITAASDTTSTKSILGTPAYIAPEAVTDPDLVGTAVDLYALGAVGYFLLTGKKVFDGKTPFDICVQHVTGTVISPSQIRGTQLPAALEQLILDLLAKTPGKRPTATALLKRLRSLDPVSDWSEEIAEAWWGSLRAKIKAVDTSSPTLTIKVNLDRVSAEPHGS